MSIVRANSINHPQITLEILLTAAGIYPPENPEDLEAQREQELAANQPHVYEIRRIANLSYFTRILLQFPEEEQDVILRQVIIWVAIHSSYRDG